MNKKLSINRMVKIGILSAIAVIIMLFDIPLWFAPSFYKIDLSEVVVLIGGFALGPVAAVFIELIKILLNFVMNGTDTAGIGELANFIMGVVFVLPAAIIYKHKRTVKSAILGMTIGTIAFMVVGAALNAYVLLPVYSTVYGMPLDAIVEMGNKLNSAITNVSTLVLFAVTPFNLVKGVLSSVLALLLYKKLSPILHK